MGNFFTSPRERASVGLYDAAMRGEPIGADMLQRSTQSALSAVRGQTSQRLSTISGDILSRTAGNAPSGAAEGLIARSLQPALAGEWNMESQIMSEAERAKLDMTLKQLSIGLAGMSDSSTFGDIMAGLTTMTNIAKGIHNLSIGIKKQEMIGVESK